MNNNEKIKLSNDIREWCHELDDNRLVVYEEYKNTISRSKEDEDLDEEESFFEEEFSFPLKLKDMPNIYNSPVGPVLIPELNDPTKHFKLWTMYSKIPLTTKLLLKIEGASGVESLEALTRYRARIGICPLFKDNQVMTSVTKIIEDSSNSEIRNLVNP